MKKCYKNSRASHFGKFFRLNVLLSMLSSEGGRKFVNLKIFEIITKECSLLLSFMKKKSIVYINSVSVVYINSVVHIVSCICHMVLCYIFQCVYITYTSIIEIYATWIYVRLMNVSIEIKNNKIKINKN